jgi:hypothetical protein
MGTLYLPIIDIGVFRKGIPQEAPSFSFFLLSILFFSRQRDLGSQLTGWLEVEDEDCRLHVSHGFTFLTYQNRVYAGLKRRYILISVPWAGKAVMTHLEVRETVVPDVSYKQLHIPI